MPNNDQEKPHLPIHEWVAVVTILGFMAILTGLTAFDSSPSSPVITGVPHYLTDPNIEVYIQGAVERSGVYTVPRGALVSDLLELAKPEGDADLTKLKLQSKLRKGQLVKVPKLAMLTVYLEGAVETPGALKIPKGTRLEELPNLAKLTAEANLKPLQKKRRLKDGEVIHISSQSSLAPPRGIPNILNTSGPAKTVPESFAD